jgi:hypothetical protein
MIKSIFGITKEPFACMDAGKGREQDAEALIVVN